MQTEEHENIQEEKSEIGIITDMLETAVMALKWNQTQEFNYTIDSVITQCETVLNKLRDYALHN